MFTERTSVVWTTPRSVAVGAEPNHAGAFVTTAQPVRFSSTVFGSMVVHSDARVLTPRPWTLMQSGWAAQLAPYAAAGRVLELCAARARFGLAAAILSRRRLVHGRVGSEVPDDPGPIRPIYPASPSAPASGWP